MNAFHPWELQQQGPVARKAGETVTAEFTPNRKGSDELAVYRIADMRRERVAVFNVEGKREARALARQLDAQPWNF